MRIKSMLLAVVLSLCGLYGGERDDFNKAYWAAQPPVVRQLLTISDDTLRENAAISLALQGVTIDKPIMLWGWEPYRTMELRGIYGYTWIPSFLQMPIVIAPGLGSPGTIPYDPTRPPPGSIKVSLSPKDYPPWRGGA